MGEEAMFMFMTGYAAGTLMTSSIHKKVKP